ncbi:MAG: ATPase [Actinobacteria bacterium]|nr:ATPase [Actinomycetota bacterium]
MDRHIIKDDGSQELFDEEKIRTSILNAGGNPDTASSTADSIKKSFKNYMHSKEVYRHALKHLKNRQPEVAIKYTLKRAIMDLGPTGYVFERYFAEVLRHYGYKTEVGRIVRGYCVEHEVDIIAEKDNQHYMIECKYHNDLDISSDVKVALYVNSRFEDIKRACAEGLNNYDLEQGWLVTNTKVTSEAIKYARCVNMKIVAWHYPKNENLENFIENKKLYPVSILQGLSSHQKNILYENNTITIQDFLQYNPDSIARTIHTNPVFAGRLFAQAEMLLS